MVQEQEKAGDMIRHLRSVIGVIYNAGGRPLRAALDSAQPILAVYRLIAIVVFGFLPRILLYATLVGGLIGLALFFTNPLWPVRLLFRGMAKIPSFGAKIGEVALEELFNGFWDGFGFNHCAYDASTASNSAGFSEQPSTGQTPTGPPPFPPSGSNSNFASALVTILMGWLLGRVGLGGPQQVPPTPPA